MKFSSKSGLLAMGTAAVVLVAIIGITVLAMGGNQIPSPDADPITVARFVASEPFEDLPEWQQRPYMRTLRSNADAVSTALEQGKITKAEYDLAKHNIWLERQLDKMDDYYKLPPGPHRVKYLDELVQSKIEKRKNPKPKDPNEPDTDDDSPFMEERKSHWPSDLKARWKEFRNALDEREKLRGL